MFDASLASAIDTILATCLSADAPRKSRLISATGAHGLVHAKKHRDFARTLGEFDMNLPDGMPVVWVGRYLKKSTAMERIRGADFFGALLARSAEWPIRHYLCGGKDGVAGRLADECRDRLANRWVVGTYTPPFRSLDEREWSDLARDIERSRADIVWIGLSTPKQEAFAHELARRVRVHYIATVGAAFDFHTGAVPEAPRVIQRSGFEWFYRMCLDPRRLVRRYAEIVPRFVLYTALEIFQPERQHS